MSVYCFHVLFDGLFCGELRVGVKVRGVVIVLEYRLLLVSRVSGEVREMVKWVVGVLSLLSVL